jgi:hypothetical protein
LFIHLHHLLALEVVVLALVDGMLVTELVN